MTVKIASLATACDASLESHTPLKWLHKVVDVSNQSRSQQLTALTSRYNKLLHTSASAEFEAVIHGLLKMEILLIGC